MSDTRSPIRSERSDPDPLDYERLAERQRALAEALLSAGAERLDWPREKLATHRRRRLRDLVGHARARSTWHRERLAGIAVEALEEGRIGELPPMDRNDLLTGWDRIAVDPALRLDRCRSQLGRGAPPGYLDGRYHVVAEPGPPDRAGVFVYAWDAWATVHVGHLRARLRRARRRGGRDPRVAVTAWVGIGSPGEIGAARLRTFGGPGDHAFPASVELGALAAGLERLRPDAIAGDPSLLEQLAREATAGRLGARPTEVVSSGSPPGPDFAAAVREAWSVEPLSVCETAAVGVVAASCGEAPGLHANDDELVLEAVDAAGGACPPGVPSRRVYATPLFQRSLPLLRYDVTGAIGSIEWIEAPCPCGSGFRRMRVVGDAAGR